LVPTRVIDAAVSDLWTIYPTPEEFADLDNQKRQAFLESKPTASRTTDTGSDGPAFREEQFVGHRTFPFSTGLDLNRLVLNERVLTFAEEALDSGDIRLYQAGLWAKYAGASNYSQPFHVDPNHSVVPARPDPGWWFLEGFLYLNDVDENNGAPELLPRHDSPALDAVSAAGPRGSFLAYRGDVWRRAVDLFDPGSSRFVLILCFKLPGQDWIGYDSMAKMIDHWRFASIVAESNPRQLAALGIPLPGHDFWTVAGVEALAEKYPGLDTEPWRLALGLG
ncbi:hypothetical protein JYT71_01505, partial [Acidimicrobiaceae bacterium AH-315-P05]|nr:hypothetical protein [Acidimicrobiaceae bacterium AH-315-P05]